MLKTLVSTLQTVMGSSLSQQSAVETITRWQSKPSQELLFDSGRRDISQYFEAVARVQQSGSNDKLISAALNRLRNEFAAVLSRQADPHAGPISVTEWSSVSDSTAYTHRYEDYTISEQLSDDVIIFLRNIAERMNASGKIGECVRVYKNVRKSNLESLIKRLRFDELKGGYTGKRYMSNDLQVKMELWVQVCKICVRILFDREKKLCDKIFENVGSAKDECFVGTVKATAMDLIAFAEVVSLSKQVYDRMGGVLAVYDAFLWVLPSANALFASEFGRGIRDSIAQTLLSIENDVGRMMYDLQTAVSNEISEVQDERGGVHRSTEHVMEQIDVIVRNKELLARLIKKAPSLDFDGLLGDYRRDDHSFLELHLITIIEVLLKNLETKSKRYQNSCLGQVFMMNNIRCILHKIEGSDELTQMLGHQYVSKLIDKLKFAKSAYQESTCNKFLNCFREKGLYINGCFKSRPSKKAIKRRLNTFNLVFEEIKVVQSFWTIRDSRLREEVRGSISAILVPAYKNFLENLESDPETIIILEKNMKHSVGDLEALVLENLFADNEA
ncbi:hypothetical protein ACS0TY_036288 [Phlomoides rotata]